MVRHSHCAVRAACADGLRGRGVSTSPSPSSLLEDQPLESPSGEWGGEGWGGEGRGGEGGVKRGASTPILIILRFARICYKWLLHVSAYPISWPVNFKCQWALTRENTVHVGCTYPHSYPLTQNYPLTHSYSSGLPWHGQDHYLGRANIRG